MIAFTMQLSKAEFYEHHSVIFVFLGVIDKLHSDLGCDTSASLKRPNVSKEF